MSDHGVRRSRLAYVSANLAMVWFMAWFTLMTVCVFLFVSRKSGMEFLFAYLLLSGNSILWGLFGAPAGITGLIAVLQIGDSRGRLWGYRYALGGIVAGVAYPAMYVSFFLYLHLSSLFAK